MKQELKGILSAILTPFSSDKHSIDERAYRRLIEFQIDAGIHGVVLSGSTGEHPSLTVAERKRLFEIGSEVGKGKADVIAHVGSSNVRDTLDLTRYAKELGVDQMLVVTPYFDRLKFADVQRFLEKVVSIAGGPIIYYDTPGITGLDITEAQMVTLRREGLVSHIKDSPANFTRTMRLLSNPEAPTVLAGSDPALLAVLAHGAPGSIIGASTFIPELCVQLYDAVSIDGDLVASMQVWDKLWPIIDFMLLNGYVALAKAGAALRGLPLGDPREPVAASPEALRAELKKLLDRAGVTAISR
ncbi:dihydrodipicolinate synthase family protein [Burkholderia multivorans]|uniref:dihydrodipicolinate synthase family protein n=1 Tax=Burkholderia multivorans TaxID=87883 RepID=UPI002019E2EC|nr:dihydrodipicolinate synthase family protein [Burkholderia multivorans]MCA8143545.1 dihydrodipicolinate synthase family protein [Burkholderia multivorans]MCO1368555.1 dihydrodipicolinate synthase family protein [Burkholderia multivorans]MCO1380446.1 dihydrodipicolinate synthase family protein [Burkholderia multivorans]UQP21444.1 dihydrodipicolinate synthase family protein [Burkholderia multivorans]UQP92109.1 dihydrodipicolinate synthase family protein [Burkholderia multivorans]